LIGELPIESLFLFILSLVLIAYMVFEYRLEFMGLFYWLFHKYRSDLEKLKAQHTSVLSIRQWRNDPRWVSCSKLAFYGSFFSFTGLFVLTLFQYLGILFLMLPRYLLNELMAITYSLFFLSLVLRIPLSLYEREKMREWVARELAKMPRETLLAIAKKEEISIEGDEDSRAVSSRLMNGLRLGLLERYVFSEEGLREEVSEPMSIKRTGELYEVLLSSYIQFYGYRGRQVMEDKISSLKKRGLNQEQAIYRLAEKEGLVEKE